MPRNASGNYSLPPVYRATPGTTIRSDQHNTPMEDIAQSLTDSLPRNGTAPMTGNLPMGGRRITGVGVPTDDADGATKGYADAIRSTPARTDMAQGLLGRAAAGSGAATTITLGDGLEFSGSSIRARLAEGLSFVSGVITAAVARFATQAEAQAGTNNDAAMTPLRVQQYVANYLASVRPGDLYSYAMLRLSSDLSGTARNQGFTTSGSNLYYATAGGNDVGASPQGTWVLMGRVIGVNDENATSVWYRIS